MACNEHEKIERIVGPNVQTHRDQFFRTLQRYCRDVRTRFDKCLQEGNVYENVTTATKYLASRPFLLASVIAVLSTIALPVLVFTIFAITTIACTFTGFIIIEGTILAFGTVVLCGVLMSLIVSLTMLGTCLALTYYICLQVYTVLKKL